MSEAIKYYEADGTSHTLTVDGTYRYIDGDGLYEWFAEPIIDELPADIDKLRDFSWGQRNLSMRFAVQGTAYPNTQANVRTLFQYFVPDITRGTAGTLEFVTDGGGTYQIQAAPMTPSRDSISPKAAEVTLNFRCPEFWTYGAGTVTTTFGALLSSGSFETYTGAQDDGTSDTFGAAWTLSNVDDGAGNKIEATATVQQGSNAAKLTTTTARVRMNQDIIAAAGEMYTMTVWSRGPGAGGAGLGWFHDVENNAEINSIVADSGTAYVMQTLSGTIPAGCDTLQVRLYGPATATPGTAYYDNALLTRTKGAAVFNNAGDVPAYPTFSIVGQMGTPTITYPSGNYIQIGTVTANAADILNIYTKPGDLRVDYIAGGTATAANWTGYAGTASDFETLPVGAGTLFLQVTSGTPVWTVTWDVYRTGIG